MSILVINPGSTSTKLALTDRGEVLASEELQHDRAELAGFERVADQFDFRMRAITDFLDKSGADVGSIRAVAGRGGLLRPLQGGVYEVSDEMVIDLTSARYGEHPCNLGGVLAQALARQWAVPAYVADPVVTDELMDVARLTGLPEIERRSLFHALNQRGAARLVAGRMGLSYDSENFVVCHMGGGITIGAHRKGRVVDVVNGLDGEGPFTPERSGALPALPLLEMINNGRTVDSLRQAVVKEAGLIAYLGTNDPREVVARIRRGDEQADLVFRAMAYSIARYAASMLPALVDGDGSLKVAAVVLTGGLARSEELVAELTRLVGYIGPVEVVPGEVEMTALADAAEQALAGAVVINRYPRR